MKRRWIGKRFTEIGGREEVYERGRVRLDVKNQGGDGEVIKKRDKRR